MVMCWYYFVYDVLYKNVMFVLEYYLKVMSFRFMKCYIFLVK